MMTAHDAQMSETMKRHPPLPVLAALSVLVVGDTAVIGLGPGRMPLTSPPAWGYSRDRISARSGPAQLSLSVGAESVAGSGLCRCAGMDGFGA
jgi:hypothetical protein